MQNHDLSPDEQIEYLTELVEMLIDSKKILTDILNECSLTDDQKQRLLSATRWDVIRIGEKN